MSMWMPAMLPPVSLTQSGDPGAASPWGHSILAQSHMPPYLMPYGDFAHAGLSGRYGLPSGYAPGSGALLPGMANGQTGGMTTFLYPPQASMAGPGYWPHQSVVRHPGMAMSGRPLGPSTGTSAPTWDELANGSGSVPSQATTASAGSMAFVGLPPWMVAAAHAGRAVDAGGAGAAAEARALPQAGPAVALHGDSRPGRPGAFTAPAENW